MLLRINPDPNCWVAYYTSQPGQHSVPVSRSDHYVATESRCIQESFSIIFMASSILHREYVISLADKARPK